MKPLFTNLPTKIKEAIEAYTDADRANQYATEWGSPTTSQSTQGTLGKAADDLEDLLLPKPVGLRLSMMAGCEDCVTPTLDEYHSLDELLEAMDEDYTCQTNHPDIYFEYWLGGKQVLPEYYLSNTKEDNIWGLDLNVKQEGKTLLELNKEWRSND